MAEDPVPIPAVSGKGWLELQETHSRTVITNPSQEFYIQLSETERFGMVKLRPEASTGWWRISPSCRSPSK